MTIRLSVSILVTSDGSGKGRLAAVQWGHGGDLRPAGVGWSVGSAPSRLRSGSVREGGRGGGGNRASPSWKVDGSG